MNDIAAATTLATVLAQDILLRREQELKKKISSYPRTMSILSDIGECDRQMVYNITNWKDKPLHDAELQALFDEGKEQERRMNRELIDLGYEIIAGQEVIEIKNRKGVTIARGKIDGKIVYQGFKIAYEVKSMAKYIFDSLESIEDFQKKPHLRKYIRQLMMYLYGSTSLKDPEYEGILLCNDRSGHWKIFVLTLDLGESEQIIQRLERTAKALEDKTLPDRIEFRDEICGRCAFAQICLPDVLRQESAVITDEELIARLERRDALAAARSEYEKIDATVKADVKKRVEKRAIAGDFIIDISKPIEVKEKVVAAYTMNRVTIKRLSKLGKDKE